MNSNFTKVTTLLAAVVLVAAGGCNSESKNVGCPSRATNVSFLKAQNISIEADCLDKQYSLASGIHITAQHHVFKFRNNRLELRASDLADHDVKALLSYSILYSSGIKKIPQETIKQNNCLNIDDVKYVSIEQEIEENGDDTIKMRLYCRLDNFLVDRIELENKTSGKTISSLCKNYICVDNIPNVFASKIELFSGKADNFDKVKIREFEYRNFKVIK